MLNFGMMNRIVTDGEMKVLYVDLNFHMCSYP